MSTTMDTHCAVDLIISQMLYNGQSVHSFHGNVHDNRNLDIYVCTWTGKVLSIIVTQQWTCMRSCMYIWWNYIHDCTSKCMVDHSDWSSESSWLCSPMKFPPICALAVSIMSCGFWWLTALSLYWAFLITWAHRPYLKEMIIQWFSQWTEQTYIWFILH